jgi:MFS family permease
MNLPFRELALELARHAGSYRELAAVASDEWRRAWKRRLAMLLLGATAGLSGLAIAWAGGLVALWDTPWRMAYFVVSSALLLIMGAILLSYALARRTPGPSAGLLRSELRKDMELFQEWKSTL